MKQIYIITIVCLLNFNFLNSQTVTVNDNTPNATNTIYTFTYTTTGEIGTSTTTPNIFLMNLPSGFPSITNTIADSNLLGSNVTLKVNGTPITIDATTFGTIGGAWSGGIQMSVAGASVGLTIPAGATIEIIITDLIINPTTTGPFTFDWKTANGGGASTEDFSATLTTLSTDNFISNKNVRIYPNPFNDFVNIHLESNSKFEVYNLLGKRILTQSINKGNSKINISEYEAGVYIFKIMNETGQIKTMKIIKR
ncbi:T9SS type A sorting domain-containing protein [Pontimicrobium aquaticum]|uniref:T9SS type A sorting domain-containing protein n=1 Tax=Pontimicrobium aquaticum TaxID=2565367 RepID=A0A4U0F3Q9_9FLAO|nr:T9SS type A sorting domain-containing protein [Pontimicrobium aquaticum]TJY37382.1 T9SS type A sorting domain-containing protein [Pontimicrobium aquaticum]